MTSRWSEILAACRAPGVPKRSFWTACVVGTILNLINQGDGLVSGKVTLWKVALTFVVPYCVATYGAVAFQFSHREK
jgi:hypothetical protein